MDLQLVKLSSSLGVICSDKNFRSSYKNIVYNSEFVLGINDTSCLLVYERNWGRVSGVLRSYVFVTMSGIYSLHGCVSSLRFSCTREWQDYPDVALETEENQRVAQ